MINKVHKDEVYTLESLVECRRVAQLLARNKYKGSSGKRAFDIVGASLALLVFTPVLLIVALLIRLQSKGPIFYYSTRVGNGYKLFRLYKFRSMTVDADKELSELKHLNQYNREACYPKDQIEIVNDPCAKPNSTGASPSCAEKETLCERFYHENYCGNDESIFIKIKDDPRVTPIGRFIRNTSLDELPQLWNVLKGDMSLVGNRPLPLYEAEKLTAEEFALRFAAPAGITGLWQVSKRGGGSMSAQERIKLDNNYAKTHNLMLDLQLLLRTIPAMLQKESV